jgi:hypothetical protein
MKWGKRVTVSPELKRGKTQVKTGGKHQKPEKKGRKRAEKSLL